MQHLNTTLPNPLSFSVKQYETETYWNKCGLQYFDFEKTMLSNKGIVLFIEWHSFWPSSCIVLVDLHLFPDRHKRMLTLAPSSVTERRTFKETESVLKYAESVLSLSAYLGTLLSLLPNLVLLLPFLSMLCNMSRWQDDKPVHRDCRWDGCI
jgi:hypothetical protein